MKRSPVLEALRQLMSGVGGSSAAEPGEGKGRLDVTLVLGKPKKSGEDEDEDEEELC